MNAQAFKPIESESELLSMPESEYMNTAQLDFFHRLLKIQETELRLNAGETAEHLRDTDSVPDQFDRASMEADYATELRIRDRERKLLRKIEQALHRIEQGEYGYCEETGEPIGLKRLLARPTTTLSIEAQQRREQRQRLFGD